MATQRILMFVGDDYEDLEVHTPACACWRPAAR